MNVLELILNNTAIRRFKKQKIKRQDITCILEGARLCQSGKNLQPWYFIVIQDSKTLGHLASLMKGDVDEEIVRHAPLAIAAVSDPSSEFHLFDTARAVQNMTLVAKSLGICSCVMSGPEPPNRESYRMKAKEFLRIPTYLNLIDLLVFGYSETNRRISEKKRKKLTEIFFEERFQN